MVSNIDGKFEIHTVESRQGLEFEGSGTNVKVTRHSIVYYHTCRSCLEAENAG